MTRCIVLDVDDTLYLERDYVRSGFSAVGAWATTALGVDGVSERAWRLFEEGCRGDIFNRCMQACGHEPSPETILSMLDVYRHHRPAVTLLPDARAFLDRHHGSAALAVVTDGPAPSQRAKVEALGLEQWAAPVVVTAEHGADYHKPSERAFALVSDVVGASGSDCVYIADNPLKDFVGPKKLGWRTVRIRREGGLHYERPNGCDVDQTVTCFDEIALDRE